MRSQRLDGEQIAYVVPRHLKDQGPISRPPRCRRLPAAAGSTRSQLGSEAQKPVSQGFAGGKTAFARVIWHTGRPPNGWRRKCISATSWNNFKRRWPPSDKQPVAPALVHLIVNFRSV